MKPRLSKEQIKQRTERQNAARERKRLIESEGLADNRYTASDQPEVALEVIIVDNRLDRVHHVEFHKTHKLRTYKLFDVISNIFIGKYGANRGIREIARRLVDNINIVE